jgi:hypothetical protein
MQGCACKHSWHMFTLVLPCYASCLACSMAGTRLVPACVLVFLCVGVDHTLHMQSWLWHLHRWQLAVI